MAESEKLTSASSAAAGVAETVSSSAADARDVIAAMPTSITLAPPELYEGRKVCLLTGGNAGIGLQAVRNLAAAKEYHIVFTSRSAQRAQEARDAILREYPGASVAGEVLNLASLQSINELVASIRTRYGTVHLLVLNAGMSVNFHQPAKEFTEDGFELVVGSNHLGHMHLTLSLLPELKRGRARVVAVSSYAHTTADKALLRDMMQEVAKPYDSYKAYALSKLLNVLFAMHLQRRYGADGITAVAVHPGTIMETQFWRSQPPIVMRLTACVLACCLCCVEPLVTAEAGGDALIAAARHPSGGVYFSRTRLARASALAMDPAVQEQAWAESVRLLDAASARQRAAVVDPKDA